MSKRNNHALLSYSKEVQGENFFDLDRNLISLLENMDPDFLVRNMERLSEFGSWVGSEVEEQASYSDRYAPPRLETHDRYGTKSSRIIFNPLYEKCRNGAYERGIIGLAFDKDNPEPHLLSFAMGYILAQSDISIYSPVMMTGAVAYALDNFAPEEVRKKYLHELTRMDGLTKTGGTWCTELHGGSDIPRTTTKAVCQNGVVKLYGLKWFTANVNSGLALATARPEGEEKDGKGLGLYLVPSHLSDGAQNAYHIRRLKDKIGTRSLATGEIDLEGAIAIEIAPPPLGLRVMMEALEYGRVHVAVAAAGMQRRAFLEAVSWATHREAFGHPIIRYPMVQNELLDIMMNAEAGTALAFSAAKAFDETVRDTDNDKRVWMRIATALAKYLTAEDGVTAAKKAVEIVGGNGYTEEFATSRLYRDILILAVGEGTANIQALELMRMVAGKEPGDKIFMEKVNAIIASLPPEMATERELLTKGIGETEKSFAYLRERPDNIEKFARKVLDHMAHVLGGALLAQDAATGLRCHNARKAVVCRRYLEKAFGGGRLDLAVENTIALEHFDVIAGYGVLNPVSAGYALKKAAPSLARKFPSP